MTRQLPRLHAVTTDEVLALPDFKKRARCVLSEPLATIQIRSGSLSGRQLTEIAESTIGRCEPDRVFVNDRADVARIVGAGGLHLPAAGLSVKAARSIVGAECLIGRSAHNPDEVARAAQEGADYVFLGPIWATESHPGADPLGIEALAHSYDLPVIAIGGVTPARAPECLQSGAYGVAAISALWRSADITSTARDLSLSFPT